MRKTIHHLSLTHEVDADVDGKDCFRPYIWTSLLYFNSECQSVQMKLCEKKSGFKLASYLYLWKCKYIMLNMEGRITVIYPILMFVHKIIKSYLHQDGMFI